MIQFTYELGNELEARGFKFDAIYGDNPLFAVGMNTPDGRRFIGKTAGDVYWQYLTDAKLETKE